MPNEKHNFRLIPLDFNLAQLSEFALLMKKDEQFFYPHQLGGWYFYMQCQCGCGRRASRHSTWCEKCEQKLDRHQTAELNRHLDAPPFGGGGGGGGSDNEEG